MSLKEVVSAFQKREAACYLVGRYGDRERFLRHRKRNLFKTNNWE